MSFDCRDDRWIQTFTGRKFWPLTPRPQDVCIEDIAHALAMTCRFGGHCTSFYSVAQHSVLVSHIMTPGWEMVGLLHDAAEAYLADITRPIKSSLVGFKELEEQVQLCVWKKFGLTDPIPDPDSFEYADNVLLETERRDLMVHAPGVHWYSTGVKPIDQVISPLLPAEAEYLFLARYHELRSH